MGNAFDSNRPHFRRDRPAYLVWFLRKSLHEFANEELSVYQLTSDFESIVGSLEEVAGSHSIDVAELEYLWADMESVNATMLDQQRSKPSKVDRLAIERIIESIEGVLSQAGFASSTYRPSE